MFNRPIHQSVFYMIGFNPSSSVNRILLCLYRTKEILGHFFSYICVLPPCFHIKKFNLMLTCNVTLTCIKYLGLTFSILHHEHIFVCQSTNAVMCVSLVSTYACTCCLIDRLPRMSLKFLDIHHAESTRVHVDDTHCNIPTTTAYFMATNIASLRSHSLKRNLIN
jgi:hypothetical protein